MLLTTTEYVRGLKNLIPKITRTNNRITHEYLAATSQDDSTECLRLFLVVDTIRTESCFPLAFLSIS